MHVLIISILDLMHIDLSEQNTVCNRWDSGSLYSVIYFLSLLIYFFPPFFLFFFVFLPLFLLLHLFLFVSVFIFASSSSLSLYLSLSSNSLLGFLPLHSLFFPIHLFFLMCLLFFIFLFLFCVLIFFNQEGFPYYLHKARFT